MKMPQLLWSLTAAPRFKVGQKVNGRYKVQRIINQDKMSQLVLVRGKTGDPCRIVRIINRTHMAESDILYEIAWLKKLCIRGELSKLIEHTTDIRNRYIFFDKSLRTLRDISSDSKLYISRRHIVEMSSQLIHAVCYLNDRGIYDMDISSENVEVVASDTVEWHYDHDAGGFRPKRVLESTRIRLGYFSTAGSDNSLSTIAEQYKSPEHVYDFPVTSSSNVFSVGCVIAELLMRKPLFPICPSGRLYTLDKTAIFDTILGPYPDTMIRDIRRHFKGVFKYDNSDFPDYESVSQPIQKICEQANQLKYLILEEYASDVAGCMLALDSAHRVPLQDLLIHPFFNITSL